MPIDVANQIVASYLLLVPIDECTALLVYGTANMHRQFGWLFAPEREYQSPSHPLTLIDVKQLSGEIITIIETI